MPALGPYLAAVAALALFLAAIGLPALRLRVVLLPGWRGARARLAEAVLMVAIATTLCLVLGSLSLLGRPSLLAAALGSALVGEWLFRHRSTPEPGSADSLRPLPAQPRWSRPAALAVAAVVTAHWGIAISWSLDAGITNFDSVWYHLPFSAEIAQSGSSLGLHRTETVFLNWLYPQGSELLHAAGMLLTERDIASLAINLGWLGLAFLAAWCIGRPYGKGHLTVAAAAILLECHNVVARIPGTAKNDLMAVALLLAATALLVNLAGAGQVGAGVAPAGTTSRPRTAGRLQAGLPFALVAVAVGLAAGTKVTALAPAAGLTVAAVASCPAGSRFRAAAWWGAGLGFGGAYWYLRNLFVAGNPLPQVRELGPLALPGPDRLQTGRPDFTVSHYLFDGRVWQDYLVPGLERGFGMLWPLVVGLALAGGLIAAWRLYSRRRESDSDQLLGGLGLVALFGMAAYLVTPLSAAGPEGDPTAFAINLRFVIPSLILGLVLLPLVLAGRRAGGWVVFFGLCALGLITNGADDILRDSGRLFGWALAIGLIILPALAIRLIQPAFGAAEQGATRRAVKATGPQRKGRGPAMPMLIAGLAWFAVLTALGYPLQRSYFEQRYADFAPEQNLAQVYDWASGQSGTAIGLAGTTAGFHGFGFYGVDLSNPVTYLGRETAQGGFAAIQECSEFRRAVNAADLDYLVTSPFLNFMEIDAPIASPEARWIAADPAVRAEIEAGPVTLWRLTGNLAERCGPTEAPHRELPDSPSSPGRNTGGR